MGIESEYKIVEGDRKDWNLMKYSDGLSITGCMIPLEKQTNVTVPNMIDGEKVVSFSGFSLCHEVCVGGSFDDPDMEYKYVNNENLWNVRVSEGIKRVNPNAFECCTKLKEVILPEGLEEIDELAFFACESLRTLVLPSSLKKIGSMAFAYSEVETLIIPGSVEILSDHALSHSNCQTVILSEGVKKIEYSAFYNMFKLKTIMFPKSLALIDERCFAPSEFDDEYYAEPFNPENITVFCYPGTMGFIYAKTHGFKVENAGF